jgi:hypothetical protein
MTPITSYSTDSYLRLILQGPPGSRKSSLACYFPRPYFIDMDRNLAGVIAYHSDRKLPLPVGYDRVDTKADGKPIGNLIGKKSEADIARELAPRYDRLNELLIAAQQSDAFDTLVLDSGSVLSQLLMAWTVVSQNFPKDGRQTYGFFYNYGMTLINVLMSFPKHVVLIVHEEVTQDPLTQLQQYRIAWPGKLSDFMGAYFTNVWRSEIKSEGFGAAKKYQQILRTVQDTQFYGLKNNLDLPAEFAFDWTVIQSRLKHLAKV